MIIQSDMLDIFLSSYEGIIDCIESKLSYEFIKEFIIIDFHLLSFMQFLLCAIILFRLQL